MEETEPEDPTDTFPADKWIKHQLLILFQTHERGALALQHF